MPDNVTLIPGTLSGFSSSSVPTGAIALDGGSELSGSATWNTQSGSFTITAQGLYKLVFVWHNDFSAGSIPTAAVDNVTIATNSCPQVTNINATSNVIVKAGTVVTGNINCKNLTVYGTVEGDILAKGGVVLKNSAVVNGNIEAARIGIESGAKLKGKVNIK